MSLSPDGTRLARITVMGEERSMVISEIATGRLLATSTVGVTKVRNLEWINNDRLLATVSVAQSIPVFNIPKSEWALGLVFDVPTRTFKQILNSTRGVAPMLASDPQIRTSAQGEGIYVRAFSVTGSGHVDLLRVNPANAYGQLSAPMLYTTEDFVLDASGTVIAKSFYDDRRRWALLLQDGRASTYTTRWLVEAPLDAPALRGMGTTERSIIVEARRDDLPADPRDPGSNLFQVDVDTAEWTRLPFTRQPESLIHHPVTGLLIGGARMSDQGMTYEFIDPAAATRWAAILRAFPDKSPVLVSWSDNLHQVLVLTGGDRSSGVYQLVDFDRRAADIVGEAYPTIGPAQVGEVRPVSYKAADGLEIHGYLTLPPQVSDPRGLPLVVLPHGGPQANDDGGFYWLAQAIASRGYAVLQPNFRGSTGYGQAFVEAGYGEWGRKMQTDLSDGVRYLAGEGIVDPRRVCIVGASYGGYAALAGATLDPDVYRCAVSIAGVSDLRRMVGWTAQQAGRRDTVSVRYWNRFMGADGLGDRSLDARSPSRLADKVTIPILLIHGRDDTVVPIEQSRMMINAMREAGKPGARLVEMPGEDHWLSRGGTRLAALEETVAFLEANNPAH
ncbi:S9 family peptidase [Brevundimonas goettingensis]|uniref:S9 family peptidase n=1 Tax=Brevundimonas goettingensis TaxID=2774190 RepID=A0A975C5C8_9CAUL|nr:S9 family peptidase [Brevundimonas goettingensis]